jgi:predicted glycosyltransferase
MYWELIKKGWQGLFVTKDKECAIDLLKAYNLPHVILGKTKGGISSKILSLPYFAYKMLMVARSFKPDIFVSRVSPLSGWSSFLMRKPHITFTDTENVRMMDSISEPFADIVLTSTAYLRDHGNKQIRYPGYHELAYLHPNRFSPNSAVFDKLSLKYAEPYALVRFVSWSAHHDIGHKGMSVEAKKRLVAQLSKYLVVYISSEGKLSPDLQKYQISIPPEDMHDVLAFAHLFVGESATMASECAMLGTPALYMNSQEFGCTNDQAQYGLLELFQESEAAQDAMIKRAVEIAAEPTYKKKHEAKREKLLADKIDVTAFMVWFVENYPNSKIDAKTPQFSFTRLKDN